MGKGKRGNAGGSGASGAAGFSVIDVDPRRVRYAHSKIKPVFSGCGRTIEQTLQEIRDGKTLPSDLPAITVLLGPADPADGGGCYFSLNNRRLFVLKVRTAVLGTSTCTIFGCSRGVSGAVCESRPSQRCSCSWAWNNAPFLKTCQLAFRFAFFASADGNIVICVPWSQAKCPQGRLWHQDSAVHVSGYAVSVLSPPAPLLPSFSPPLSLRFLEALYKNFASVELDNKTV